MASQCSGNIDKLRTFEYNSNEEWENKYFFVDVNNKCVCLYEMPVLLLARNVMKNEIL
jgi:hypothetical protein